MSATATQRRTRAYLQPGESAAIALTAQLLSGLKTSAADALYLIPSLHTPRYFPASHHGLDNCACSEDDSLHFQRQHGSPYNTTWFGTDRLIDRFGRVWERRWRAVVDDFGNLVEVPQ